MDTLTLLRPTRHDVYPFIDGRHNLSGAASGKIVLVTGAGGKIGRGIAVAFGVAGAASVILTGRRTSLLQETKTAIEREAPETKAIVTGDLDITKQGDIEQLFDTIGRTVGVPDIVVANAGTADSSPVIDSNPEQWWNVMTLNVFAAYAVARSFLRALRAANKSWARIINVSSHSAWLPSPGFTAYTTSKAALNILTESLDTELLRSATPEIRVVAYHPGGIVTELSDAFAPEDLKQLMVDTPELAGGTALYLSTSRADYLLGRFIDGTWDMEELEALKDRIVGEDLLRTRPLGISPTF